MIDDNGLNRLAAMGAALRPDWPAASLRTFLERNLVDRTYGDVAVALAWVATRTRTETPRLLLESGAWWKAAGTEGTSTPRPPRRDEACATCGRSRRMHLADRDRDHEFTLVGTAARDRSTTGAERARAALHEAKRTTA